MHPNRPCTHPAWLRWTLALALFSFLPACAELPKEVERPVSKALSSPDGTPLGALVRTRQRAASTSGSGFLMLDGPQRAYGSRLALVDAAQKTLDLQYYAIHADASSARLLRAVRDAAGRGVRVRILLDDFHSTGRNALVMLLAFEKNIEMRMFNPLAGPRGSFVGRMFNALDDAGDLQQRMHNKLFIADNAMAVTGGRNLGDAYFGNGEEANFVDLDVLSAGPIVQELSRSFDSYWNNERAYPVQSLVTREELDKIRQRVRRTDAQAQAAATQQAAGDNPKPPDGEPRRAPQAGGPTTTEQRRRAWDQKAMDLRTAPFVWAPAVVLVDEPAKIPAADAVKRPVGAQPSGEEDNVVDGLLALFGSARSDLTIVSPYFVPGKDMKAALAAAHARGVRIRVLTNSLASNDAVAAHAGYARHRKELLAMGVELYEMRSARAEPDAGLGSSGASVGGSSRSMLHSKVLTLDGRLIVIGSMNLDLRSQLQNTEIALLIRSEQLARLANERIEAGFRNEAWRVEMDGDALVWRAPPASELKDTRSEPDTSVGQRLLIRLFGPLAPDRLL
ncbi:MAG TPA: phospholipase D family protein [Ramlibacter sp.]|nr:phospholipase D family protein [Ramlibacter sp.]